MAWTIVLGAILYLRAMRQPEEAKACSPSRWSLSGGPEWQQRAQSYSFALDYEAFRANLYEFRCYIEDLTLSLPVSGLPPSLAYFHHSSREQYVYTLTRSVAELRELFSVVINMVGSINTTYDYECHLTYSQPSNGEIDYPSLPIFLGKRIWQQPQLGVPRVSHKEQSSGAKLLDALKNPRRFIGGDGRSRGVEAGLSALLELCLVWADLDRLSSGVDGVPAYLQSSTMVNGPGVEVLKQSLLAAALAHTRELRDEGSRRSAGRPAPPVYDAAARSHIDALTVDLDAELQTHQQVTAADPLLSRIRNSVLHEKTLEARGKSNEELRRDQNALNLAAHRAIHPAKPAPPPIILPELERLHEALEYTPTDAPSVPSIAATVKKQNKRSARAPSAPSPSAPPSRPEPTATIAGTRERAETGKSATLGADIGGKRPRNDDRDRSPSKRRRLGPTTHPEDRFSLSPHVSSGSDSDSDASLPLHISHRKPLTRETAPVDEGCASSLSPTSPAGAMGASLRSSSAVAPSADYDTADDKSSSGVPQTSLPRPRRTDPKRRGIPGISTGFQDISYA